MTAQRTPSSDGRDDLRDHTRRSILVVDDEPVIRDFLAEALDNYEVTVAADGDEAISRMNERRFDLIITDMKMPRVSGDEVVKYAMGQDPAYKIIVISGYSSLFNVSRTIESGACAFLSKPFSIGQLRAEVSKSIGAGLC